MTLVDDIITQLETWDLYTSPQTISNGTFADATDWTLGAGWAVAGGVLARTAGASTTAYITPIKPLVVGWTYQVRFSVSGRLNGNVTISIGDTDGSLIIADGDYDEQITCGGITDPTVKFTPNATFDGDIDNVYVCPRPILLNKKKLHEVEHAWAISVEVMKMTSKKPMINGTNWIGTTPFSLRCRCNGVLDGNSAESVRNAFREQIISLIHAKTLDGYWLLVDEDSQDHADLSDLQLNFKQVKYE